jgi:hypothetical protein
VIPEHCLADFLGGLDLDGTPPEEPPDFGGFLDGESPTIKVAALEADVRQDAPQRSDDVDHGTPAFAFMVS